ncbi:MAG: diadenylate cyclase CdaA [Oscillospiraceae bacterium]|nr:diadenylate cyclase CdaA [Oscillospiraceae bacterium]
MEAIRSFFTEAFNYISSVGLVDIADIIIIAFLIYKIIELIRKTASTRIAKGLVILLIALWLSGVIKLTVVNFLLRNIVGIGLLALIILFQPELRRILEKVGSGQVWSLLNPDAHAQSMDSAITQTVLACHEMSVSKTGAIIVFERGSRLVNQVNTGTLINADVTAELLKNIFFSKAPLHDGAVIIRDARITAAGCMLPLSSSGNLSRELGMRHRAGIGVSEHSDAVTVIVSEETGTVSVAVDGMLKRHLTSDTFEKLLRNELLPEKTGKTKTFGYSIVSRIAKVFKVK